MLLATIPSPDRGVWQLGPVPIRAYALFIIVGIIAAIWWGERRLVARGGQPGTMTDIAVFAVPFGLVGGRIYHVLTDWQKYFGAGGDPLDALKIWQGGLGIWGAIALGALGAWIGARRRGVPLTVVADAAVPGIVLAQAIGRLGNWFNQELFGGETSLPWGLEIYRRVDPDTGELNDLVGVSTGELVGVYHPTFLYELLWNVGIVLLLLWAERRWRLGRGRVFALYVAAYTVGRFWIELLRIDPATMVFGVRINVITSVVVFLGAVAYLLLVRGPREVLAPTADAEPTPDTPDPDTTGTTAASPDVSTAPDTDTAAPADTTATVTATPDTADVSPDVDATPEPTQPEQAGTEKADAEKPGAEKPGT